MYKMHVMFTYGRISVDHEISGADRQACLDQIQAAIDQNPVLEYSILSEGPEA